MFDTLRALPEYNWILKTAVDTLMEWTIDLRSVDELVHQRAIALGLSIDSSSAASYDSALNSYHTFCSLHNFPVDPTVATLPFFVVYMSHRINPQSVATYLSGIANKLEPFYPERTLAGCKRLRSKPIRWKGPLSREHFRAAAESLSPTSSLYDIPFVLLLFTGFCALTRLGELTTNDTVSKRQPHKYTRRNSATTSDTEFSFVLATHKADRFFKGSKIDGAAPHLIQAMGRRSSDTFQIYI
ncbi:hypothetical protein CYLTODRAFT_433465 [Cylindrobasidium torrendii FP15055 ss-10]|uniref:Uncharacterized protein n=1 Tax=Cylindrobasidium torrendii FP15055 ss-10 TaxID=1314674 RepID=A0A0D7AV71_9AGAR|nr:hypothetical protein CYLTODRAFT_433465 [Cylindrobasidium torrendii FP15055 ss-10]